MSSGRLEMSPAYRVGSELFRGRRPPLLEVWPLVDVGICVEAWLMEFRDDEVGVSSNRVRRGLAELGGEG